MQKERISAQQIENSYESKESGVETSPEQILKILENNDDMERESLNEVTERIKDSDPDFQQETAESGVLSSLGEKVKENKLLRAALVGLSLCSANSAFASGAEGILSKAEAIESVRPSQEKSYTEKRSEMAESLKNKFAEHISSPDYLNRLVAEFNGDLNKAEKEQFNRLERTQSVAIDVNSDPRTWPKDLQDKSGYYDGIYHKIYIDRIQPNYLLTETINHELSHASTVGRFFMSEKAKEKLSSAYQSPNNEQFDMEHGEKTSFGMDDEYLSSPEEMLARKQQFDLEMESLGIKKYGEKFTQEHYKKMMEKYDEDGFSDDGRVFIETIKKSPSIFEDIFNNIARIENEEQKPNEDLA